MRERARAQLQRHITPRTQRSNAKITHAHNAHTHRCTAAASNSPRRGSMRDHSIDSRKLLQPALTAQSMSSLYLF
jgi:hypothetical protein